MDSVKFMIKNALDFPLSLRSRVKMTILSFILQVLLTNL